MKSLLIVIALLLVVGGGWLLFGRTDSQDAAMSPTPTPTAMITEEATMSPTPSPSPSAMGAKTYKYNFSEENNSGISGTATLTENNGKTTVTLAVKSDLLNQLLAPAEPAHVHLGSCSNLGAVKYPLASVVKGRSITVLNVTLATLKTQLPLAINLHKSASDIGTYIGCTDLAF